VSIAVGGGRDLPAPGQRPAAPQSAGPSRFGSESVRRDLGNMSVFRDQQTPGAWPGPVACTTAAGTPGFGCAECCSSREDLKHHARVLVHVACAQYGDGALDDYSDLPPMSGLAQQHSRQQPFCPSGLRDDGYTPSLHGQV
jgi:hypothetical protein